MLDGACEEQSSSGSAYCFKDITEFCTDGIVAIDFCERVSFKLMPKFTEGVISFVGL
jgi:hypothetical protein